MCRTCLVAGVWMTGVRPGRWRSGLSTTEFGDCDIFAVALCPRLFRVPFPRALDVTGLLRAVRRLLFRCAVLCRGGG